MLRFFKFTYDDFSRAQKPSRVIPGQDIYSLDQAVSCCPPIYSLEERSICPSSSIPPFSSDQGGSGTRDKSLVVDPPGQWSCPSCTYLNLSRYLHSVRGREITEGAH